jgi:hypothetical protein
MTVSRKLRQRLDALGTLRSGMTLIEVFVALSIFTAALAVITQIIHTGSLASVQALLVSDGVLRAESKLAEAASGAVSMQSTSGTFEDDANWSWTLSVAAGPQTSTLLLTVDAAHSAGGVVNAKVSLSRLIRDPQIYADAAGAATTSGMELLQ